MSAQQWGHGKTSLDVLNRLRQVGEGLRVEGEIAHVLLPVIVEEQVPTILLRLSSVTVLALLASHEAKHIIDVLDQNVMG